MCPKFLEKRGRTAASSLYYPELEFFLVPVFKMTRRPRKPGFWHFLALNVVFNAGAAGPI